MPIIDVEIVLKPNETVLDGMVNELADELGVIFRSQPGGTWVKVHELLAGQYAENGGGEEGVYPIFVYIMKSRLPSPQEIQLEIDKITGTVAQICDRSSSNVHVIYHPEGNGRVAFGGNIVK